MRVISFDIGIKTLSFAVFDTLATDPLADWKIFNMCERQPATCCAQKGTCVAAVKYTHGDCAYCKRHAKLVPGVIMPGTRHSPTQLSKMAVSELLIAANELGCTPTVRTKKALITTIREYYDSHTLVNYVAPKAADVNMVTLAERIRTDLNSIFPSDLTGYVALIENQLGPQAVRMRCVQAMLTMQLLYRGCADIQYISPRRKLQDQPPQIDVSTYPARKKAARDAVPHALTEMNCNQQWHSFFAGHKKQDDLADAFLQARWYIKSQGH